MITRRGAILLSIGGAMEFGAFGFAPGEFWNDKQPSEWSSKDVERLLTKIALVEGGKRGDELQLFRLSRELGQRGLHAGRRRRPRRASYGRRRSSGRRHGWRSGRSGRARRRTSHQSAGALGERRPDTGRSQHELPPEALEMYVISLSGLPGVGGVARGRGPTGQEGAGDPAQEMRAGMKQNTTLQRRGKAAVAAVQVAVSADGITILFFFPKAAVAISLDDKEVDFRTQAGPLEFKTKFLLKEMLYRGKLQL